MRLNQSGPAVLLSAVILISGVLHAEAPLVLVNGETIQDVRLESVRNLNHYFPFKQSKPERWPERQQEIKQRILVSQGLWPLPERSPLHAVVHGRVERDDYVVDRVFFESYPGHFVTGSLYRPKGKSGKRPAILSPHGHWNNGRFYEAPESQIKSDLENGAERYAVGGRYPIQARAVQLARMGCIVFVYDMTGNADSIQLKHRPDKWSHLDKESDWGFFSAQAELRLQNMMGLQTWNSIRSIDFLETLPDVDTARIGVTGASGGGTQSMILGAIDDRIAAAMPCVMVSTAMQGGCTCENAPYLRIDQGNVDIAAAVAPRPLGLTAADDWTIELETKGYPDLRELYTRLGHADRLTAAFNVRFKHNYNAVNRAVMYDFFNRHFELGHDDQISERDFKPLSIEEATVWTTEHPAPSGDLVGDVHEVRLLNHMSESSSDAMAMRLPLSESSVARFQATVGGGWATILRRDFEDVDEVQFKVTNRVQESFGENAALEVTAGVLSHDGESVPVVVYSASQAAQGTVIWLNDVGKSGLYDNGSLNQDVARLVRSGYQVIAADLFQQGEFVADGDVTAAQRMWFQPGSDQGWRRFSGYTYGFNDPLFVRRAHDVLKLVRFAHGEKKRPVRLVAMGKTVGPVALAATSRCGDAVAQTYVDTEGFRFESLRKQDDPMFVPGAVKYLGVDGLTALCAPQRVEIVGPPSQIVDQVYRASGDAAAVRWHQDVAGLIASVKSIAAE